MYDCVKKTRKILNGTWLNYYLFTSEQIGNYLYSQDQEILRKNAGKSSPEVE